MNNKGIYDRSKYPFPIISQYPSIERFGVHNNIIPLDLIRRAYHPSYRIIVYSHLRIEVSIIL
jgi:hypothetical protein